MTPPSHRNACVSVEPASVLEPTICWRLLIAAAWLRVPPRVPRSMGAGWAPSGAAMTANASDPTAATRRVRRDAIVGGLIACIALELGKHGFAAYLLKVPTYKAVYGAFAVLPVFLLWVYFSWLVTLTAALIAANLAQATGSGGKGARA